MGCYNFKITALAAADIDEALAYVAGNLNNKKAAKDLYRDLLDKIHKACKFPMMYPDCELYLVYEKNIRHAFVGNYALIYEINEAKKEIQILRFLYQMRDVKSMEMK